MKEQSNRKTFELYAVPELSHVLDVSEKTVLRILQRGDLRGRKVGRRWTVTRQALEEYLGERQAS